MIVETICKGSRLLYSNYKSFRRQNEWKDRAFSQHHHGCRRRGSRSDKVHKLGQGRHPASSQLLLQTPGERQDQKETSAATTTPSTIASSGQMPWIKVTRVGRSKGEIEGIWTSDNAGSQRGLLRKQPRCLQSAKKGVCQTPEDPRFHRQSAKDLPATNQR